MTGLSKPLTRIEQYLAGIAGVLGAVPETPLTRIEAYLKACYDGISGVAAKAAENLADTYDPESTYSAGDYVTNDGILYKAIAASANPAGEFNPLIWESVKVMDVVDRIGPFAQKSAASGILSLGGQLYISSKLFTWRGKLRNDTGSPISAATGPLVCVDVPKSAISQNVLEYYTERFIDYAGGILSTAVENYTGRSTSGYAHICVTDEGDYWRYSMLINQSITTGRIIVFAFVLPI